MHAKWRRKITTEGEKTKLQEPAEKLSEHSRLIGERLEKIIEPVIKIEERSGSRSPEADKLWFLCEKYTRQVEGMLDAGRDFKDSSYLVMENGLGHMARFLARKGVDVVSLAPGESIAHTAKHLNPFPSIIYKRLNPYPPEESCDIIIDTGVLCYYPRELFRELLVRLADRCRRKMIVPFHLSQPWYKRSMRKGRGILGNMPGPAVSCFDEEEIVSLFETDCGMLLSEWKGVWAAEKNILLVKALKKAHQRSHHQP